MLWLCWMQSINHIDWHHSEWWKLLLRRLAWVLESSTMKVPCKDAYGWPFGNFLGAECLFTAIVLRRKAFGSYKKGFNMSADSLYKLLWNISSLSKGFLFLQTCISAKCEDGVKKQLPLILFAGVFAYRIGSLFLKLYIGWVEE